MKSIEQWKEDVFTYLNNLNSKLQKYDECKKLYYGFEVIDGELRHNPKILFIGINPGKGNGKLNYKVKMKSYDYVSYLDYYTENYRYHLAERTISYLRKCDFNDEEIKDILENDVVKTNRYFITTENSSDIKKCISNCPEINFKDFIEQSDKFILELIKILKPKTIIFEGYGAVIEQCAYDFEDGKNYYFSEIDNAHFFKYSRSYNNSNSMIEIRENLKILIS